MNGLHAGSAVEDRSDLYAWFWKAVRESRFGDAEAVLQRQPSFIHVHPRDPCHFTLGTFASREEDLAHFDWLLSRGAHPHFDRTTAAFSPLYGLAACERYGFIEVLVDHFGVDVLRAQRLIKPQTNAEVLALRTRRVSVDHGWVDPVGQHPSFRRGCSDQRAGLLEHAIRVGSPVTCRELLRSYPQLLDDRPVRWISESNGGAVGVEFLQMARELQQVYPESVHRVECATLLEAFVARANAMRAVTSMRERRPEKTMASQ